MGGKGGFTDGQTDRQMGERAREAADFRYGPSDEMCLQIIETQGRSIQPQRTVNASVVLDCGFEAWRDAPRCVCPPKRVVVR